MGIKNIHVLLIVISILLSVVFGFWLLDHAYTIGGYISFIVAIALVIYLIQFVKKMKVL